MADALTVSAYGTLGFNNMLHNIESISNTRNRSDREATARRDWFRAIPSDFDEAHNK